MWRQLNGASLACFSSMSQWAGLWGSFHWRLLYRVYRLFVLNRTCDQRGCLHEAGLRLWPLFFCHGSRVRKSRATYLSHLQMYPGGDTEVQTVYWSWLYTHLWQGLHFRRPPIRALTHQFGPRQNGRHFEDDIFKHIFLIENLPISINISLNFVPRDPIGNKSPVIQTIVWRRKGDTPLSKPSMH